jgi:pullulanase/glycogen debranching enzyme
LDSFGVSPSSNNQITENTAHHHNAELAEGSLFSDNIRQLQLDKIKYVCFEQVDGRQVSSYSIGLGFNENTPIGCYSSERHSTFDPKTGTAHFVLELGSGREFKSVNLLLFSDIDDHDATIKIPLTGSSVDYGNSEPHTRYSIALSGIPTGTPYAFELIGNEDISSKTRWICDHNQFGIVEGAWLNKRDISNPRAPNRDDFIPPKSILMDPSVLERGVVPPLEPISIEKLNIYEIHVKYTASIPDQELPIEYRGTQGTIKCLSCPNVIEHLKSLGLNTIELMPLQAGFAEWFLDAENKVNEWNYNPSSFLALKPSYFHATTQEDCIRELQDTISALHQAGMYVIIDGVFGHNSETSSVANNTDGIVGPLHSLMAVGEDFHHRDLENKLMNISGCGNTINFDSPKARALLLRAAEVMLIGYGFDGIRIDQAPVLARKHGHPEFDSASRTLLELAELADKHGKVLIAEPTDCGGPEKFSYFHGRFPHSFAEQNISARNYIQLWLSGHVDIYDRNTPYVLASMLSRSLLPDEHTGKRNYNKPADILMADCHDGQTLWDRTEDIYRNLTNAPANLVLLPEIADIERREEAARYKLAQASAAFLYLRPGPFMLRYNTETLASQDGDHNAYTNDTFLKRQEVVGNSPIDLYRKQFSSFLARVNELRESLPFFDAESKYSLGDKEPAFFNENGTTVSDNRFGYQYGVSDATLSERERAVRGRFLGALYGDIGNSSRPADMSSSPYDEEPVYVAYLGTKADFDLPKLTDGRVWVRIFDSQLSNPFQEVEIHLNYQMNLPGLAAFKAVMRQ